MPLFSNQNTDTHEIQLVILPWRVFSDAGIYFVLMHYFSTRMVDRNKFVCFFFCYYRLNSRVIRRVGLAVAKLIALAWLCVQLTTLVALLLLKSS